MYLGGKRLSFALLLVMGCQAEFGAPAEPPIAKTGDETRADGVELTGNDVGDLGLEFAPPLPPCVEGNARASTSDGTCVFAVNTAVTWSQARTACQALGADLAMADTMEKYTLTSSVAAAAAANDFWLGGNDVTTEGSWRWLDATTAMTDTHWRVGEPNNGNGTNEDCMVVEADTTAKQWDDRACTTTHPYVCARLP